MSFENEFNLVQDPSSLSKIALLEAYQNVATYFNGQKESIEKYKQKIYTLEQEKNLKDSVQEDELQALAENFEREVDNVKKKFMIENRDLHNRLTELNSSIEKLELENEHLKCELEAVSKRPQAMQSAETKVCKENEVITSMERIEHLERLEVDHLILIDDKANLKDEILRLTSELAVKAVMYPLMFHKKQYVFIPMHASD